MNTAVWIVQEKDFTTGGLELKGVFSTKAYALEWCKKNVSLQQMRVHNLMISDIYHLSHHKIQYDKKKAKERKERVIQSHKNKETVNAV